MRLSQLTILTQARNQKWRQNGGKNVGKSGGKNGGKNKK